MRSAPSAVRRKRASPISPMPNFGATFSAPSRLVFAWRGVTAAPPSIAPPALLHLVGLPLGVRAEGEQVQAVGPGLPLAHDGRRAVDDVLLGDVDDLVVELEAARAGQHDVHLLRLAMGV